MYKPKFSLRRPTLVFRHFGNKGYSLFSCLGREVVCSVLSVSTLTYASAESVSTKPVVSDSASTTTAREMVLEEVSGATDQESGCENGNCTGSPRYCAGASTKY